MQADQIYRIYTKPSCPWGKKAEQLLKDLNLQYQTHHLNSKEEVSRFKDKHHVATTPQIFQDDHRIGGYSDLNASLGAGKEESGQERSYTPVVAVFSTSLLMSVAVSGGVSGFMGFSLSLLAALKLMDLKAFQQGFQNYDLITQKIPAWGFLYPFLELMAGLGFLSGSFPLITGSIALLAGITGGYSVYKAVILDKKDLNCACIGGNSRAPLGLVSFTENAVMSVMGLVILAGSFM